MTEHERQTGATPESEVIPYDVVRAWIMDKDYSDTPSMDAGDLLTTLGAYGMVIVPASDVLTPEMRAAVKYVTSFLDGYKAPEQIGCAVWDVAETFLKIAGGAE